MKVVVSLVLLGFVLLATAQTCPSGGSNWSAAGTWPSGTVPVDGESVTILAGTKVILDASSAYLDVLTIEAGAELIFADKTSLVSLRAQKIVVQGTLWIGGESCPYLGQAEILLVGGKTSCVAAPGVKVLHVPNGGRVEIHGDVANRKSWSKLGQTALKSLHLDDGASVITLADTPNWKVGDKIVIASTDYHHWEYPPLDKNQNEVRTVTAVNGASITLDSPLDFMHWGEYWRANQGTWPSMASGSSQTYSTDFVDIRGEVARLTRNIVLHGDMDNTRSPNARTDGWGGHFIVNTGGVVHIEGLEVYDMGQRGELGRYPVHFHLAGDVSGSYLRHSSIHDTFQRCLVLHWSHNFEVTNNVGFRSVGHCFFLEDALEHGNKFEANIGIDPLPGNLLVTDKDPAVYWITSPDNDYIDNVAVGGTFGYWYSLPETPIGLAVNEFGTPQFNKLGIFRGNAAHGAADSGLFFDNGIDGNPTVSQGCSGSNQFAGAAPELTSYSPRDLTGLPTTQAGFDAILANMSAAGSYFSQEDFLRYYWKPLPAVIEEFTGWKNRNFGIWGRGDHIWINGCHLADNQIGAQFPGEGSRFYDCTVVGETGNVGNPPFEYLSEFQGRNRPVVYDANRAIIGYRNYDNGGPQFAVNTRFHNFRDFEFLFSHEIRGSGAISSQGGPGVLPPINKMYNTYQFNVSNHYWFEPQIPLGFDGQWQDGERSIALPDADGSMTGVCGSQVVVPSTALIAGCTAKPSWNAYHCPPDVNNIRYVSAYDVDEYQHDFYEGYSKTVATFYKLKDFSFIDLASDRGGAGIYNDPDSNVLYKRIQRYQTNLPVFEDYLIFYASGQTPANLALNMNYAPVGEWINLAIPYPPGTVFSVKQYSWVAENFTQVNSYDELRMHTYFYDTAQQVLWVHLTAERDQFQYNDGIHWYNNDASAYIYTNCPVDGCAVTINPTSITSPGSNLPKPKFSLCEKDGGLLQGQLSLPAAGNTVYLFGGPTDGLKVGFNTWATGWKDVPDDSSYIYQGPKTLQFVDRALFYASTANDQVDVTGFTHFEFMIRLDASNPDYTDFTVTLADDSGDLNTVAVSHPKYVENPPINSAEWKKVSIPLADLGLTSGKLKQWQIGTNWPIYVFSRAGLVGPRYVDNVALVSYASTTVVPDPSYLAGGLGGNNGGVAPPNATPNICAILTCPDPVPCECASSTGPAGSTTSAIAGSNSNETGNNQCETSSASALVATLATIFVALIVMF